MGSISKLIGGVVGNVVALGLLWMASKVPAVASCTPENVCSLFGIDQTQITASVMIAFNAAFVYFFPANKPKV